MKINMASFNETQNMFSTVQNGRAKENDSVFFGGNSARGSNRAEKQEKYAKNQASKLITDVFKADKKMDQKVDEIRSRVNQIKNEVRHLNAKISDIDNNQKKIREEYGIHEEDQEYQDLLLLNKQEVYTKYGMEDSLTSEEKDRIKEIKEQGLTEYQKESLANQSARTEMFEDMYKNMSSIQSMNNTITGMKLERLKIHPMADAKDMAQKILEASEKSIKGLLIDESLQKIKDEDKEREDGIEKAKEEKDGKEAALQKASSDESEILEKPKDDYVNQVIDNAVNDDYMNEVNKKIKKLNEYLKGLEIDKSI